MKNSKIIFLGLIVSISTFSLAGYGETNFKKKIEKHILYPTLKQDQMLNAKVHVEFSVNSKGEIIIDEINSTNSEINDYVITKLKELKVEKGNEVIGKSYVYNFSFEVEK